MKILVLADSHGNLQYMLRAVKTERPDMIIHLGDGAADARVLAAEMHPIPVLGVQGNCDFPRTAEPLTRTFLEGNVRFFLTHGHTYGVKNSLLRLSLAAREAGAQVALFGHTHLPYCQQENGIWFLNPGSCRSRLNYGVVSIEKCELMCYNVAIDPEKEKSYAFDY